MERRNAKRTSLLVVVFASVLAAGCANSSFEDIGTKRAVGGVTGAALGGLLG